MPRLFVAIDLPEQQRQELVSIYNDLPPATRWTPPPQLHLTLRFIGETDTPLFLQIKEALAGIHFSPFAMQIRGLGHFPFRGHPNILWAGVTESHELRPLQELIEMRLVRLGIAPETRRFHPHFTIARLSPRTTSGELSAYLAKNGQFASAIFQVDSFHLYSSLLSRNGAVHQREMSFSDKL